MDIKESDSKRSSMANVVLISGGKKLSQLSLTSTISSTNGQLSLNGGGSTNGLNGAGYASDQMRRPFGVAAIDLTPIIKKPEDFKNNLDLPFILCEKENLDNTLKKLIANKDVGKIDSKLAVSVELLHGDIKQVIIFCIIFIIFFIYLINHF